MTALIRLGILILIALLLASSPRASEALENGQVVLGEPAAGDDLDAAEASSQALLVVIDSPYQVFDDAGTLLHVAAWTPDGRPAAGADVYLSGHRVGQADEHGALAFRWGVPGNDVESYWLNGSAIDVRWKDDGDTYGGRVWFSAFSRTSSFASDHLFVYTDRGIYNPGQRIRTRLVGWHLAADYTPIGADGGAAVELLLNDPSGRAISGGSAVTDDLGTAWLDLEIPGNAEEGMYELVARYNGAQASARLRIERFEPPVIDIAHTLGRFLTRDQPSLDFEVELAYFTGGEFREGTIILDLLVDEASVWHDERAVVGPGPHAFSFGGEALEELRADLYEDERIEVQIAVEDTFGRRDDLKRELRYTANPYVAIIEADRDYYSTDDPIELVVRLTDRDRVPVRDTAVRLESGCSDDLTATTDAGGTVQFSLVMPEGGCEVSVWLSDVGVPLAERWLAWQERQPMRSHIADAIVEEGEPTHIRITFPADFEPAESVVHVDVVDTSGSLVRSLLVPIRREGADFIAEGTFEAPSWGSMLLTLFCLGRQAGEELRAGASQTSLGLMTEGQNLAVHPGRELTVHLDGIPDEMAPGSDFSGQIRVTDRDGHAVEAAVGASLVDMSVISLQDPLEITPMDHFYNPELRVISTTGSAILTWPVVSRNWGSRVMDVALPPFPYLAGGPLGVAWGAGWGGAASDVADGEEGGWLGSSAADEPASADPPMDMDAVAGPSPDAPMMPGVPMMMESAAEDRRYRRHDTAASAPEPTVITIRTELPETALWEPGLRTDSDGSTALHGSLPDSITRQQFTVVASDGHGGVGVLRREVQVTQPLFVRSDLPDTLTVGDRIEARVAVQNLTDVDETVAVTITAELVDGGVQSRVVSVPAQGTAVAVFAVEARRAGQVRYTVAARAALRHDMEERDIWVRPAGAPVIARYEGTLSSAAAWSQSVPVPVGGQMTTATLNVAFPAIGAAFAGLDAIRAELTTRDTMGLGGEIIATALLYQYQTHAGVPPAEQAARRAALEQAAWLLQAGQRGDGGWGLWWDKDASPYVTAYALEALMTLREAGIGVQEHRITSAVDYLARSLDGQTWDMGAIAFWEGNTETVRLGLSAEIFSILARVPEGLRPGSWEPTVMGLAGRLVEYLDAESPDVLTYAHAVLGLQRLAAVGAFEVTEDRLLAAARRLTTMRREAHWEPSWFNAYGGTIEATVAVLQVFAEVDRELLAGDLRETVGYLLSTRDEWGGWHNPRGTAAAIRGLTLINPAGPEVASTVTVRVDGREVASVPVDPADPFLSAITLRALDLSRLLQAGEHRVEVVYDGNLELDVRLAVRHWADNR